MRISDWSSDVCSSDLLGTNLQATRDRFEVGDLTRTDVAQSEARLAGAQSLLTAAQGDLIVARENYLLVVATLPQELEPPPPLPALPPTATQAVDVAERKRTRLHTSHS